MGEILLPAVSSAIITFGRMHMKKTGKKSFKRLIEDNLLKIIIGALILIVALVIVSKFVGGNDEYVVTADGHVHAADGTHIGVVDENGNIVPEITEEVTDETAVDNTESAETAEVTEDATEAAEETTEEATEDAAEESTEETEE